MIFPLSFKKTFNEASKITVSKYYWVPECLFRFFVDYPMDFWSLGICVYFMLNKRYPFETTESLMFNEVSAFTRNLETYRNLDCWYYSRKQDTNTDPQE